MIRPKSADQFDQNIWGIDSNIGTQQELLIQLMSIGIFDFFPQSVFFFETIVMNDGRKSQQIEWAMQRDVNVTTETTTKWMKLEAIVDFLSFE